EDAFRIFAVDCNGDGKPEIVVTNIGENTLSIFSIGVNVIEPVPGSPVPAGQQPYSVVSSDWNRDGLADLIVSNHMSDRVSILRGLGNAAFASPESLQVPTDEHVHKIHVSNFTTSGIPFILTERFVLPANDPANVIRLPLVEHYHDYLALDFNGDGKVDIAAINGLESRFALLMGDGKGNFSHADGSPSRVFGEPQSLRPGDITEGGKRTLIVSARADGRLPEGLFLIENDGDSFVIQRIDVNLERAPGTIGTGDINGDGRTDIVARLIDKPGLTVLQSNPNGFDVEHVEIEFSIRHFALVDANSDGKDDLAVLNDKSREVLIYVSR
ncbi:MAG: VCBS repeat-containing protein, partial [Chlorobiales bacterium]|nr:VCBS repeat-containing protein [Chlorobiales bacterium]